MNSCRLAPNGKPSKVYTQLRENLSAKQADKVFMYLHSNEFKKSFGDWTVHAKMAEYIDPIAAYYGNNKPHNYYHKGTWEPNVGKIRNNYHPKQVSTVKVAKMILKAQSNISPDNKNNTTTLASALSQFDNFEAFVNIINTKVIKDLDGAKISPEAFVKLIEGRLSNIEDNTLIQALSGADIPILKYIKKPRIKTLIRKANRLQDKPNSGRRGVFKLGSPVDTNPQSTTRKILNHSSKVTFTSDPVLDKNGDPVDLDPFLQLPVKTHKYTRNNDDGRIKASVTTLKKDYKEYIFDDEFHLERKLQKNTYEKLRGFFEEMPAGELIKNDLFATALENNLERFMKLHEARFKDDPLMLERVKEFHTAVVNEQTVWRSIAMAGTQLHRITEAVLNDEKSEKDVNIINELLAKKTIAEEGEKKYADFLARDNMVFMGLDLFSQDSPFRELRMIHEMYTKGKISQSKVDELVELFNYSVREQLRTVTDENGKPTLKALHQKLGGLSGNAINSKLKNFLYKVRSSQAYATLLAKENALYRQASPENKYMYKQEILYNGNKITIYPRIQNTSYTTSDELNLDPLAEVDPERPNFYYRIPKYKDMTDQEQAEARAEWIKSNRNLRHLGAVFREAIQPYTEALDYAQYYNDIMEFKATIEARGGRILTEVIVHSDKVLGLDGKTPMQVAGQIDILAVYDDKDGVDDAYRGTVEIYDLKSNKNFLLDEPGIKDSYLGFGQRKFPEKLSGYAFQMLVYKRILEEELGLTVKDCYIIPIHTPDVDTNTQLYKNFKMQKFHNTLTSEDQFPGSINIKEFKTKKGQYKGKTETDEEIRTDDILGYDDLLKRVKDRIPEVDYQADSTNQQKKEEGGEKIREQVNSLRKESQLKAIVEQMQINITKQLDRLKRTKNSKEKMERVKALENDIKDLDNISSFGRFIREAYENIKGLKDKKGNIKFEGLQSGFIRVLNAHLDPAASTDIGETIKKLDEIRIELGEYDVLKDIKQAIDNIQDDNVREALQSNEEYKQLEELIEIVEELNNQFIDHGARIMAKRLVAYASVDSNTAIKEHLGAKIKRMEEKLAKKQEMHNAALQQGDSASASKHYKAAKQIQDDIKEFKEKIEKFAVDEDAIVEALKRLPKDVSITGKLFHSSASSSDVITALFAKMIKFQVYESDIEIHNMNLDVQLFLEDNSADLGIKDNKVSDQPKEFFQPILEIRQQFYTHELEDGTTEARFRPVLSLISPHGTAAKIKGKGPDGEDMDVEIDYIEATKYYKYMLATNKEKDPVLFKELQKEYEDLKRKYMERPYKKEYYEALESLPEFAREAQNVINNEIDQIVKEAGTSIFFLEDADAERVATLEAERRGLRSEFNNDGTLKTGRALEIAQALQEHAAKMSKFREWHIDENEFENRRSEARQRYSGDDASYFKWLSNNQKIVTTDEFKRHSWALDTMHRLHKLVNLVEFIRKNQGGMNLAVSDADTFVKNLVEEALGSMENYNRLVKFMEGTTAGSFIRQGKDKALKELVEGMGLDKAAIIKTTSALAGIISEQDSEIGEVYDQMFQIINPYKKDGKYDINSMDEGTRKKVLELEQKIDKLLEKLVQKRSENKEGPAAFAVGPNEDIAATNKKEELKSLYFDIIKGTGGYDKAYEALVEEQPTRAYWAEYYLEKAKYEAVFPKGNFTNSTWYKANHGLRKGKMKPRSIWMYKMPRERQLTISNTYKKDKAAVLAELKKDYPNADEKGLQFKYRKSDFYKTYHEENGDFNELGKLLYLEARPDDQYIVQEPSGRYRKMKVREEYVRSKEEVYDDRGRIKPKTDAFVNPAYTRLMSDPSLSPMKKLHQKMMEVYDEAKQKIPEFYDMGYTLPFLRKTNREILLEKGASARSKSKTILNNMADNLVGAKDIDAIEGSLSPDEVDIDRKFVPMQMTTYLDPEEQSYDVLSSITQFYKFSSRHNSLNNIIGEARTTMSLLTHRDLKGEGVTINNSLGVAAIDSIAKRAGLENRLMTKNGLSNQTKLIKETIEMQIFHEMNIPQEVAVNLSFLGRGKKALRVDKAVDSLMGIASMMQIGGAVSPAAAMKGIANAMQARAQILIEDAAGEFVEASAWQYGKRQTQLGGGIKDLLKDFGKVAGTSKTSQLFDHYDALQGEFYDSVGDSVSQGRASKLINTSGWFINQYSGEIVNSLTLMNAMLGAMKVDADGNVYSQTDYRAKKAWDKGYKVLNKDGTPRLDAEGREIGDWSQLSETEIAEADKEHREIKDTLYEALEIDPKTRKMLVRKGVNWKLGSPRDKQFKSRLHAVSERMNGAYAKLNKSTIQRRWYGRLLMMYRKYFFPSFRRRFGALQADQETGGMMEGYYRSFFKSLFTEWRRMLKHIVPILLKSEKETGFSTAEKVAIRRAVAEIGMLIGLALLTSSLLLGKGDDEEEIPWWRMFSLYELIRLRRETSAMVPTPHMLNDNWKLLSSTSSIVSYVQKPLDIMIQMFSPFETYETNPPGYAEKGDSKLATKFLKLFGNQYQTPEELYRNIQRS